MKKNTKDIKTVSTRDTESVKSQRNTKKLLVIIILLIIGVVAAISLVIAKANYEKKMEVIPKDNITLETGSEVPVYTEFFAQTGALSEDVTISFKNTNEKVEDRDNLITITKYFDKDGNEVSKDDAMLTAEVEAEVKSNKNDKTKAKAKSDAEGKLKEVAEGAEVVSKGNTAEGTEEQLNDGYTKKTFLRGTYSYDVTIKDNSSGKEYSSKLTLKDTTAPKLTVKDVEITEGDKVKATDFFKECQDNSYEACGEIYFVKEVEKEKSASESKDEETEQSEVKKDASKTEKKPEYEETDSVNTDVGEHEVLLQIKDGTGNTSEVSKAKLKVNEKPKEVVQESSSGSSNRSTGSSRNYSGGNTRNSSGGGSTAGSGNSGGSACGSQGYTLSPNYAYAFWGCNGADQEASLTSTVTNEFYSGAGYRELLACEAKDGGGAGSCVDSGTGIPIYDKATYKKVGFAYTYSVHNDANTIRGQGYVKPGYIQFTSKNF